MSRMEAKLEWLRALFEAKHIAFGALSDTLTKEMKINKWKELHGMAQALGLVPATKDYTYTRDTFWQNMRKLAVKKRDNSRKTGSGKVIITKIDDAVYDIIGKDTPTLDGLPVEESFSSLLTSSQPSTTNESSCTTSQPLNTASTSSQQQISIEKENIPPKRNKKEEENFKKLKFKKLKLTVEFLEKKNYLLSLQIKQAEKEHGILNGENLENIQVSQIEANSQDEQPETGLLSRENSQSEFQNEEFLDEDLFLYED